MDLPQSIPAETVLPPAFRVGDIEIQQIVELHQPFMMPSDMFPSATEEALAVAAPRVTPWALDPETGRVKITVQSYLARTSRHTVLIDTCIGCGKTNPRFPRWVNRTDDSWLTRLAAAGVQPEDVDFVFCTHLHTDHGGWNTRLLDGRWVPTFPNAKYILAREEVAYTQETASPRYNENVLPVIETGQAVLVDMDYALDDEIQLTPTPGHTPGHVAVQLTSKGERAVMWGDLVHSPLQCIHPEWSFQIDTHPEVTARSRQSMFETCVETKQLVLTAHFPAPSIGHILEEGAGFWFEQRPLTA